MINLKYKYLLTIYSGIVKGKSVKKIHQDLVKDTMKQRVHSSLMLSNAKKIAKRVVNQARIDKDNGLLFIPLAFRTLNEGKINDVFNKNIFDFAREQEANAKDKMIVDDINNARNSEDDAKVTIEETNNQTGEVIDKVIDFKNVPKIFYLTSRHNDSAEDHKPYQGKLYVDAKWKTLIKDERLKAILEDFISKNVPYTFQWLIGKPVWFITRPNCRHYYLPISVEEALNNSNIELLKKYDMTREIGQRGQYQTMNHPTNKKWYTIQNVKTIIKKYRERLKFHLEAKKINDNIEVQKLIKKDRLLIKKWTEYLQTIK